MEGQNLLKKINGIYVLKIINSYTHSFNFIYKLIIHCKSEQERLKINLFDYQRLYHYKTIDLSKSDDDKDTLNLLMKKFWPEDEELFKEMSIKYFLVNKPNIYENSLILRLESPFSDIFLKRDLLVRYFDIFIPVLEMREKNLLQIYKNKLEELNKSNLKYYSLYLQLGNSYDKFIIDSFHLKFNQITKLRIDLFNFRFHYNPLFSINDIRYNLIYLSLNNKEINYRYGLYPPGDNDEINASYLQIINEFISLKYLMLDGFNFNENFVLSLSHLQKLSIKNCKNIIFEKNIFLELNSFELKFYSFIRPKSLLDCPEIKECIFDNDYSYGKHKSIINFSSLKKLEKYTGHWRDFLFLENTSLKEIKLGNCGLGQLEKRFEIPSEEHEQKIFEKICSIKSLKSINFCEINGNSLPKIKMDNKSVSKITIRLTNNLNHIIYRKYFQT